MDTVSSPGEPDALDARLRPLVDAAWRELNEALKRYLARVHAQRSEAWADIPWQERLTIAVAWAYAVMEAAEGQDRLRRLLEAHAQDWETLDREAVLKTLGVSPEVLDQATRQLAELEQLFRLGEFRER